MTQTLVNFQSDDPKQIEHEFKAAVDDYLEFCQAVGKEPDKEYKGTFNIRIQPELHKKLATLANKNGETLNSAVEKAILAYVESSTVTTTQLQQIVGADSKIVPLNSGASNTRDGNNKEMQS